MVKKLSKTYRLSLGLALIIAAKGARSQSVFPTGVTIYNPAKAYNSFILHSSPDNKSHLIDMNGNEVKSWSHIGFPSEIIDPKNNGEKKGSILLQLENGSGIYGGIFDNKVVGEQDWNGNTVWQWGKKAPGGEARQNHDLHRLENGNTLLISFVDHIVPGVSKQPIGDQTIYEVNKNGDIVWSWNTGEHIDEFGISPLGRELLRNVYAEGRKGHGFLTINDMQPIGPNKWFDSGDTRFHPDNIVIDSREASFIAIIEKKTGKIVWRLGPDFDAKENDSKGSNFGNSVNLRPSLSTNVPRPVDRFSGQHDAHIISKGLPGAGNLLVFDNQGPSGYPQTNLPVQLGSRVLEIDPVKKEIVWQYTALNSNQPVWNFYSSFISSARRLPNGNTLIDEGMNGRIFQVTPAGEIVWEYINPFFKESTLSGTQIINTNWVFRAQPVPYNWVPDGTPHSEKALEAIDISKFKVIQGNQTLKKD
ncbi:aryl-sulfate sulfotransferase [Mucilaginibacter auburnensis]|uniref:Arylsulfotransferase ASST n=1 Tax=Mucilaginibacter auburnensis TaxID=1457233 RepID=A0A2H9VQI8_9SPHI|nr:aryl-sulfate sulfotransferase [Mucilaginibacter auburnensis]PJJ83053.1 arylsulfotransferase ASST [Mucilaginibacter auburnensis]